MQNQLNREARWALWLTFIYLAGWCGLAYGLPQGSMGLLGFPLWFEAACLYFPFLFICLVIVVIKTQFRHIDLNRGQDDDE